MRSEPRGILSPLRLPVPPLRLQLQALIVQKLTAPSEPSSKPTRTSRCPTGALRPNLNLRAGEQPSCDTAWRRLIVSGAPRRRPRAHRAEGRDAARAGRAVEGRMPRRARQGVGQLAPAAAEGDRDTGAMRTALLDQDRLRLRISTQSLPRAPRDVVGVGGSVPTYLLDAELLLKTDGHGLELGKREILVVEHDLEALTEPTANRVLRLPSVLGLEVLRDHRLKMTLDLAPNERVVLEV